MTILRHWYFVQFLFCNDESLRLEQQFCWMLAHNKMPLLLLLLFHSLFGTALMYESQRNLADSRNKPFWLWIWKSNFENIDPGFFTIFQKNLCFVYTGTSLCVWVCVCVCVYFRLKMLFHINMKLYFDLKWPLTFNQWTCYFRHTRGYTQVLSHMQVWYESDFGFGCEHWL